MQTAMRMTLKETKSPQAYTDRNDERRGVLECEMRHVERRRDAKEDENYHSAIITICSSGAGMLMIMKRFTHLCSPGFNHLCNSLTQSWLHVLLLYLSKRQHENSEGGPLPTPDLSSRIEN